MKDCKHKPMRKNCPVCLYKQGNIAEALRVAEEQLDKMITLNEKMDKVLLREIPEPSGYAYEDRGTWVKSIDYSELLEENTWTWLEWAVATTTIMIILILI